MLQNNFDEALEMAIIKIQSKINVTYDDANLIGTCIAHAYFEIEGDALILANKFNLDEEELAALTRDKKFYDKKVDECSRDRYLAYYAD